MTGLPDREQGSPNAGRMDNADFMRLMMSRSPIAVAGRLEAIYERIDGYMTEALSADPSVQRQSLLITRGLMEAAMLLVEFPLETPGAVLKSLSDDVRQPKQGGTV